MDDAISISSDTDELSEEEIVLIESTLSKCTRLGRNVSVISIGSEASDQLSISTRGASKPVCQNVFEYLINRNTPEHMSRLLSHDTRASLDRLKDLLPSFPGVDRILSILLSRKWPKWQEISVKTTSDSVAIDALIGVGWIQSMESVTDWRSPSIRCPQLEDVNLLHNLDIFSDSSQIDILLGSFSTDQLKSLLVTNKNVNNKTELIEKIKKDFNGNQLNIFGIRNDLNKLFELMNKKFLKYPNNKFVLLSPQIRRLFVDISFLLDIDADPAEAWDSPLPISLTQYYSKGCGFLTPQRMDQTTGILPIPDEMILVRNRAESETLKILGFLENGTYFSDILAIFMDGYLDIVISGYYNLNM